ncbi:MAG: ABC transporter ATP-binding protein [Granulosicoccus sp.]
MSDHSSVDTAGSNARTEDLADHKAQTVLEVDLKGRIFQLANDETLHAVGALQFSLPADSFTCIIGPSGCGKTTTLRMILGLDTQYEGLITLPQRDLVAAVFQEPRLLPWRTVEQNIRLVLPASRSGEALDDLFAAFGLSELRDFFPGQLSLGLARRAALARAFVLEPQLLILDEPFVSLDESTAQRLRQLLMDLWQSRPTTALMVTHNVREAATLADQILVFSDRPTHVRKVVDITTPRSQRDAKVLDEIVHRVEE